MGKRSRHHWIECKALLRNVGIFLTSDRSSRLSRKKSFVQKKQRCTRVGTRSVQQRTRPEKLSASVLSFAGAVAPYPLRTAPPGGWNTSSRDGKTAAAQRSSFFLSLRNDAQQNLFSLRDAVPWQSSASPSLLLFCWRTATPKQTNKQEEHLLSCSSFFFSYVFNSQLHTFTWP